MSQRVIFCVCCVPSLIFFFFFLVLQFKINIWRYFVAMFRERQQELYDPEEVARAKAFRHYHDAQIQAARERNAGSSRLRYSLGLAVIVALFLYWSQPSYIMNPPTAPFGLAEVSFAHILLISLCAGVLMYAAQLLSSN